MNVIVKKKMKKGLILAAAVCLSIAGAKAQTSNVKVNVVLNPAFSIEVDNSTLDKTDNGLEQKDAVNLVYRTASDYATGVKKDIANHLKVTSVGTGYKIFATADSRNLQRTSGEGVPEMAGEIVTVKVGNQGNGVNIAALNGKINQVNNGKNGTTAKGEVVYTLGNSNSTESVVGFGLNVEYAARALNTAEVKSFLGQNNAIGARYTVNVTYSILAD